MQRIARLSSLALILVLSGCTPALYVRLFNVTGALITVSNTQPKDVITIAPGTAADISLYEPHQRLVVRGAKHSWSYSLCDFYQPHWPLSRWEQHMGVMRIYGRIDSAGRIYMLAPPSSGSERPHDIPQPHGFPIAPRNET